MSTAAADSHTIMETIDFGPATTTVTGIVTNIRDDQLGDPTPCPEATVADLLDHLGGLALAFRASALKEPLPGDGNPQADGSRLEDGWREDIAERLGALAEAWRDPAAYGGMTQAGPIEMPAEVAALVALDEVVVHGWDLARATGQPYDLDDASVRACLAFAASFEVPGGAPDDSPFGPPVPVPDGAPALDRLAGATGRDPAWTP
jgi:uncharacterized protein (TIGR03086 family)